MLNIIIRVCKIPHQTYVCNLTLTATTTLIKRHRYMCVQTCCYLNDRRHRFEDSVVDDGIDGDGDRVLGEDLLRRHVEWHRPQIDFDEVLDTRHDEEHTCRWRQRFVSFYACLQMQLTMLRFSGVYSYVDYIFLSFTLPDTYCLAPLSGYALGEGWSKRKESSPACFNEKVSYFKFIGERLCFHKTFK